MHTKNPSHTVPHAGAADGGEQGMPSGTELIVVAASAGGVEALQALLSALPADFPAAIAIVQHRTAQMPQLLARVLARASNLPVKYASEGEAIRNGTVYLAPADRHLVVCPDMTLALQDGHRIRHVQSSANPLFETAAHALGPSVIGVVLTGGDSDATDGVQAVRQHGGKIIAQDEATSRVFAMPKSAISTGCVDYVLPLDEIGRMLVCLVMQKSETADGRAGSA